MRMRLDDIKVYRQTEEKLNVVATFGATAQEWPPTLTEGGKQYQFSHNELMEDWMIGNYSGHAVYLKE